MSNAEIISAIEKMTILELADLVKEMEEKFGVSAAAPVVAGGAVAAAAEEVEENNPVENPDTGANDVVGIAAAMGVVALVSAAAVSLKK